MLQKDFYPTPEHLIEKMLEGIQVKFIDTVLEPSAGDGRLADAICKKFKSSYEKVEIDCIEIDKNLRHILRGKKYPVVHDDFLTYQTMKEYDLILANFPFSDGCKHLLKALEMQERNGGGIICLINAETLKNPYTNERKYLVSRLSALDAEISYIPDAFLHAERKTHVEVALIRVKLPEKKKASFILDGLKKAAAEKPMEEYEQTAIADRDILKSIVTQYKMEVEAGVRLIREYQAIKPFILEDYEKDEQTGEVFQSGDCLIKLDMDVNSYVKAVRGKYWKALFHNKQFMRNLTGKLKSDFYSMIGEMKNYEFSLFNIYELKLQMIEQVSDGIEKSIVSMFDELSYQYSWLDETSKNIHYFNGWKTNKAWIVNKKVILPLNAFDTIWKKFRYNYNITEKLSDLEQCFKYLEGNISTGNTVYWSLEQAERKGESKNIWTRYFTLTFYKKGTCHILFNNEELLKKFNIFGAQHKKWLPPAYGKAAYSEMNTEEQAVIDSFEGKESYEKVFKNREFYMMDLKNTVLKLEGE